MVKKIIKKTTSKNPIKKKLIKIAPVKAKKIVKKTLIKSNVKKVVKKTLLKKNKVILVKKFFNPKKKIKIKLSDLKNYLKIKYDSFFDEVKNESSDVFAIYLKNATLFNDYVNRSLSFLLINNDNKKDEITCTVKQYVLARNISFFGELEILVQSCLEKDIFNDRKNAMAFVRKIIQALFEKKGSNNPPEKIKSPTKHFSLNSMPDYLKCLSTSKEKEIDSNTFELKITKCHIVELLQKHVKKDLIHEICCQPDYMHSISSGFVLKRDKTINDGAKSCDHRYERILANT